MIRLRWHPNAFAICKLPPDHPQPDWLERSPFYTVSRTATELSVTCREDLIPAGVPTEAGFRLLSIEGTIAFETVGVIAGLSACLAREDIPVIVQSTFDTDYILVKNRYFRGATKALRTSGYEVD